MLRTLAMVVVIALAGAACGGGDAPAPGTDGGQDATTGDDGAAQVGTLTGVLEGDAQLEGGCAWLEVTGGRDADIGERVEPLLPAGVRVEFEPELHIVGPDGEVLAARGEELVVVGRPAEDVATVCQVGPAYEVDAFLGTVDG